MFKLTRALAPSLAAALLLSACSSTLHLKSYLIEVPDANYKRLRIGVPTAGAGAGAEVVGISSRYNSLSGTNEVRSITKAVIDPENIMAIVQNEVMRSLGAAGKKVILVDRNAELDLQISFQPPGAKLDLYTLLSLGMLTTYESLGGARLIDVKTGKVLYTYEFISTVRDVKPPTQIRDWEAFAKALAEEVTKSLGRLKLAEGSHVLINVDPLI